METIQKSRFLDLVPVRLTAIRDALDMMKPRLVKVTNHAHVNPADISSICEYPEDMEDNDQGGRVNITMTNDRTFETFFKTAEEAIKNLGLA